MKSVAVILVLCTGQRRASAFVPSCRRPALGVAPTGHPAPSALAIAPSESDNKASPSMPLRLTQQAASTAFGVLLAAAIVLAPDVGFPSVAAAAAPAMPTSAQETIKVAKKDALSAEKQAVADGQEVLKVVAQKLKDAASVENAALKVNAQAQKSLQGAERAYTRAKNDFIKGNDQLASLKSTATTAKYELQRDKVAALRTAQNKAQSALEAAKRAAAETAKDLNIKGAAATTARKTEKGAQQAVQLAEKKLQSATESLQDKARNEAARLKKAQDAAGKRAQKQKEAVARSQKTMAERKKKDQARINKRAAEERKKSAKRKSEKIKQLSKQLRKLEQDRKKAKTRQVQDSVTSKISKLKSDIDNVRKN